MVEHLIKEALSLEKKDSEHWRLLARSMAGELQHYYKSSRLSGRLAGRYRLQYMAMKEYATELENVLSRYLKNCSACNGDDSARWHCPECSEHWELITNAENALNVINFSDMSEPKDARAKRED